MDVFQLDPIPGNSYSFIVSNNENDQRLDVVIASKFPRCSRSFFKYIIQDKHVAINETVTTKSGTKLKTGNKIIITFPEKKEVSYSQLSDENLGVTLIYTHEHFLVIDKPAGLLVHPPAHEITEPTLIDWLLRYHKDVATVGYDNRPGIIHRLDKNTSGLLIIARTNYAHTVFAKLFHDRKIHKIYHAITTGHPDKTGIVSLPIGRDPHNRTRMKAFNVEEQKRFHSSGIKMRPSTSHYKVLEYFEDTSFVEIKPVTGRTHQIRVHLKSIGHPLVGDFVYGQESKLISRHALHAYGISFIFDAQEYTFFSLLPKDFAQFKAKLSKTAIH